MKKNKFFLGMALGAAFGVVAGLFVAPKSGKENRAEFKKQSKDVINNTKTTGKKIYHSAKKEGQKLFDKVFRKNTDTEDYDEAEDESIVNQNIALADDSDYEQNQESETSEE